MTCRLDRFDETVRMYRETVNAFAERIPGFRGMMGMIDRSSGHLMSLGLHDSASELMSARDSELNQAQVERYQHLFLSDLERELYKVEVRYMPMNRPFPGQDVCYARVTSGFVQPRDVNKTIRRSRDSVVFSAIAEKGCCGFFLCANHETGKIMGFSMWDTIENLELSEGQRGYYHRELAKSDDLRTSPYERQIFEVFARADERGLRS